MKSFNQKPYIQSIFIEQRSAEHPPQGTAVFVADHNVAISIKLSPAQCDQIIATTGGVVVEGLNSAIANLDKALG